VKIVGIAKQNDGNFLGKEVKVEKNVL